MSNYIDGFVHPIPRAHLGRYRQLVSQVAAIWREHGAITYQEFEADDLELDGTASFTEMLSATDTEVVIFGWVSFESRAARDLANQRVAADPRMIDLLADLGSGFDAQRMAYAGFKPLLHESPPAN